MPIGQAQDKLREKKRNHIFNIIASNKDLSKVDIKRLSGYSMTSVISLIEELEQSNLITVALSEKSNGGRPPQKINIKSAGGYIIGVDFSKESMSCAVYNLRRERINYINEETEEITTIQQFINKLIVVIEKSIQRLSCNKKFNLLGVGIGVPGYIDEEKGTVSRYNYISDYKDVPIRKILREHFKVPVFLENNVNAIALGYKWLKKNGQINSFMTIAVRRGVKASLIINNQLIKGANDYAGEIGNLRAYPKGEITLKTGETYEEILSDYTIKKVGNYNNASDIIKRAQENDSFSIQYLNELADVIAELINYGLALVNPKEILLVGGYIGSKYFLDMLENKLNVKVYGGSAEELGTIGAAGLVLEKLYSY